MSNIFKSIKVREIFSNMFCHLLFGKLSQSKVSNFKVYNFWWPSSIFAENEKWQISLKLSEKERFRASFGPAV